MVRILETAADSFALSEASTKRAVGFPSNDNTSRKNLLGFVVVGRLINEHAAADLARITSSDIVFREAGKLAVSTLPLLKEAEFSRGFPREFVPTELVLGNERFHANAVELAPGLGLSDCIVDVVETGRTLEENGLEQVEEVAASSARLIVNRASYHARRDEVGRLVDTLGKARP